MSVLRRQRWDSGGHVRGRRLLLRHLHGHFISGQDVLHRGDTKNKLVDVCVSSVSSGLSEELFFFFFSFNCTATHATSMINRWLCVCLATLRSHKRLLPPHTPSKHNSVVLKGECTQGVFVCHCLSINFSRTSASTISHANEITL